MHTPLFITPAENKPRRSKWLHRTLSILLLLLTIIVAAIPGSLHIMRRADAQVALGNAKSLRIALDTAAAECYGSGVPFYVPGSLNGVTEEVWRQVIIDSKVPGDFWVQQITGNGCGVQRFCYQEGDFSVTYCREPLTYEVFYQQEYIRTKER